MFGGRSRSILYLDSDADNAAAMRTWLRTERNDCEVVWSTQPNDAETLLATRRFELLILASGPTDVVVNQLCRQIREWDLITPIIIFASPSANETDVIESSGATAYVSKPDVSGEMLSVINKYLPRRSSGRLLYTPPARARATAIL
jgi:DNA-binding response OmpR family regulator